MCILQNFEYPVVAGSKCKPHYINQVNLIQIIFYSKKYKQKMCTAMSMAHTTCLEAIGEKVLLNVSCFVASHRMYTNATN